MDVTSISVTASIARGADRAPRSIALPTGATARDVVRALGLSPEGSAVLIDGRPVPMDRALSTGTSVVVVPTFSGG